LFPLRDVESLWCSRNQLLLIDLQLPLAKALAANFDLTEACEAKFGYNLFLSKVLDRSHQQLIMEAPTDSFGDKDEEMITSPAFRLPAGTADDNTNFAP
jgi:hypothetical protein